MLSSSGRLSLKMRWMIWRSRLSLPVLLARFEERKVVSAVAALNGGLAILTLGLFAWLTGMSLVFPALGPSAFILFSSPLSRAAAPRSVILGHSACLVCGYSVWRLVSLVAGEPVSMEAGGWPLICSASLALAMGCGLLVRLGCPHPPACASALVFALGAVPYWYDLFLMAGAITWLTYQAVFMNRLVGLPVPLWSPRAEEWS